MRYRALILLIITSLSLTAFTSGCSSSEESTEEFAQPPKGEFQRIDADDEITPIVMDTATTGDETADDLPNSEKNIPVKPTEMAPDAAQDAPPAESQPTQQQPSRGMMLWSVQIGAFKVESGAIALINEAKSKFNQPVYKDFDPVTNFYKVNVGSFATRDQASQFKMEVQSKGYPDAFTVEARR